MKLLFILLFTLSAQAKLISISQYGCVTRAGSGMISPQEETWFYEIDAKIHFYFREDKRPNLNGQTDFSLFCHDIETFGLAKNPEDPFLDEVSNVFHLWDKNPGDLIPLKMYSAIYEVGDPPILGYMKKSKFDPYLEVDYCPHKTEGLYLAVSEPSYYIQDDGSREYGPDSVLLIKESSLDKISFLDGGRLSFYYPPNRLWPLEKRTDQKKYTIHSKEYLDGDLNQKDSIRKIGCIPKVDKEQKPYGLGRIGQKCNSDYTCASLCCKHRRCAGHNPSMGAYCSKSVGQSCVSRNYCAKQIYESCYIVKTGKRPGGEVTCALRCYQNRIFPRCRNSRCTRVDKPPVPAFNPANPDCSEAIDPPLL